MVVDADKLAHDSLKHVQHPPLLRVDVVKVQLCNYLVNVVQVLNRKVLEPWVLSSLAVDLQEDVLVLQLFLFDDPVDGVVGLGSSLFRNRAHADQVEVVVVVVALAEGGAGVGAVVLVVGHDFLCGHLAPEIVGPGDPDVHQGL